jgi:hypothetical protein
VADALLSQYGWSEAKVYERLPVERAIAYARAIRQRTDPDCSEPTFEDEERMRGRGLREFRSDIKRALADFKKRRRTR